jgi:hypothetical protein
MSKSSPRPFDSADLILQYRRAFIEHGDTPEAVLWPRGRQALRFNALTRHFREGEFSVLDYGCGLGHLKTYLDQYSCNYKYYGVDLVPEFVRAAQTKFPTAQIQLVDTFTDVMTPVDHVVASGVFNIIQGSDKEAYVLYVHAALIHLFSLTRVSLSINFMTDRVDFRQPQALHMNVEDIARFTRRNLSPRLVVDESYMPYEFTLVVFKDAEIMRPNNIYRAL